MTHFVPKSAGYRFAPLLLSAAVLLCSGCVTYLGYGGPYEGRVIDRDTRQAIEGAVIHGIWHIHDPCSKTAAADYHDSRETVTDKKGEFKINGIGLRYMSCVDEMDITVFKAGYAQQRLTPWSALRNPSASEDVDWEGGKALFEGSKAIFKLRRLTAEERRKREVDLPDTPDSKRNLFRIEMNREQMEIRTQSGKPSTK
jgi:hypothetical protein